MRGKEVGSGEINSGEGVECSEGEVMIVIYKAFITLHVENCRN